MALEQTNLRNCISTLSDQAAVLAAGVSVQVRREFGVGANGGLDRNNDIAGEVGNSSHYEKRISNQSVLLRGRQD